jgi:hypothetical protein
MSNANTYIIWANDNKRNINNLDELLSWIEFLNNEAKSKGMPFSVQLQKEENSSLLFTVGLTICHLEFYSVHDSPIIIGCRGSWKNEDEIITFLHGDEPSEMEKKYFVPLEEALQGIEDYYLTGRRPQNIQWGDKDI